MDAASPASGQGEEGLRKSLELLEQLSARNDEPAYLAFVSALDSPHWKMRRRGAELLARMDEKYVARLQEQFATLTENQRHWALLAVAWARKGQSVPWLRNVYSARSSSLRSSVISALAEVSGPECVELLMKALEDDSWLNRYAAAEAIEKRGEEVLEHLKRGFQEGKGDIKLWSLQLLVRIFGKGAYNFLNTCRSYDDPDIRHYAIRALGESDQEWAIQMLVESLADSHWTNRQLASRILVGKGRLPIKPLLGSLATANADVAYWAIQTLTKIGDEEAVKPIGQLVLTAQGDRAGDIREWGIEALAQFKSESSARRLVEIAGDFPEVQSKVAGVFVTFAHLGVRTLLKESFSPNEKVKDFCRETIENLGFESVASLLKSLDKMKAIDLDPFFKAMRTLSVEQLEMVCSKPKVDIGMIQGMARSRSLDDQSGISRIMVRPEDLPLGVSPVATAGAAPVTPNAAPVDLTAAPPSEGDDTLMEQPVSVLRKTARHPYRFSLDDILSKAINVGASDIHLKPTLPPIFRIQGRLGQTDFPIMNAKDTQDLISKAIGEVQYKHLLVRKELDIAYEIPGVCRFRLNAFTEINGLALVARVIPSRIPTLTDLESPRVFRTFCNYVHGMILICGPTGSGKSTTLAAMIDYINDTREEHILTIEDPVEFRHSNKKCLITYRELGSHTLSFGNALRSALREDPDIILVGELRDHETMELALTAAETGHLVLSTMHTGTAAEAVDRLISSFPSEQQNNTRLLVASVLKAVVCQMLVPTTNNKRVAASEVLINNFATANLIRERKLSQIDQVIVSGHKEGMQSRDEALFDLYRMGRIAATTAVDYCSNRKDMEDKLKRAAK